MTVISVKFEIIVFFLNLRINLIPSIRMNSPDKAKNNNLTQKLKLFYF